MTDQIITTNKSQKPNQNLGLTFNWEDWMPYFDDADISNTQKREMIEMLWHIVVAFVDLGFELNPQQQAAVKNQQESCGRNIDLKTVLEEAVLRSDATTVDNAQKSGDDLRRPPPNPKP